MTKSVPYQEKLAAHCFITACRALIQYIISFLSKFHSPFEETSMNKTFLSFAAASLLLGNVLAEEQVKSDQTKTEQMKTDQPKPQPFSIENAIVVQIDQDTADGKTKTTYALEVDGVQIEISDSQKLAKHVWETVAVKGVGVMKDGVLTKVTKITTVKSSSSDQDEEKTE
jgi:hypothetical protein